jgi:hypothetical protein
VDVEYAHIFAEKPRCAAPNCKRDAEKKGYCPAHFLRWKRGADLSAPIHPRRKKGQSPPPCSVSGCHREARAKKLCEVHRRRRLRGRESDLAVQPRRPPGVNCDFGVRIARKTRVVLDRQAAAMRIKRSELVRIVLENWARDVTAGRAA